MARYADAVFDATASLVGDARRRADRDNSGVTWEEAFLAALTSAGAAIVPIHDSRHRHDISHGMSVTGEPKRR